MCDSMGSHPNSTVMREGERGSVAGGVTHCEAPFGQFMPSPFSRISIQYQRSFVCPIDGCLCSYKRQDHLNRHLLKHGGELLLCPKEDCKLQLSTLSNLKRHLKRHRERGELWQSQNVKSKETMKHCCPEPYCKKAFKYPSNLAKHLDDVHSTTYTEVICCKPGCLKYFTNAEALKEHLRQNHNRVCCEICGSQQLKKQIKRHMRIHENQTCVKSIACPYERCLHSYTGKSNLNQHIQSVHVGLKPFKCQFGECGKTYAHKSARDRHEMSGAHCYVQRRMQPFNQDHVVAEREKHLQLTPSLGRELQVLIKALF